VNVDMVFVKTNTFKSAMLCCPLLLFYGWRAHLPSSGWKTHLSPTIVVTASHHKTGTFLLWIWNAAISTYVLTPVQHNFTIRDRHNVELMGYFRRIHFNCIDTRAYQILKRHPFRLLHLIRDPIELVISAYWYHRRTYCLDKQAVHVDCATLFSLNLTQGLIYEAQQELASTLPEIMEVLISTAGDTRVLTMGLEDFMDDFITASDAALAFLYPNLNNRSSVLAATRIADLHQVKSTNLHVNSDDDREMSREVISTSNHLIWHRIRQSRNSFGYVKTASGSWRCKVLACTDRGISRAGN